MQTVYFNTSWPHHRCQCGATALRRAGCSIKESNYLLQTSSHRPMLTCRRCACAIRCCAHLAARRKVCWQTTARKYRWKKEDLPLKKRAIADSSRYTFSKASPVFSHDTWKPQPLFIGRYQHFNSSNSAYFHNALRNMSQITCLKWDDSCRNPRNSPLFVLDSLCCYG